MYGETPFVSYTVCVNHVVEKVVSPSYWRYPFFANQTRGHIAEASLFFPPPPRHPPSTVRAVLATCYDIGLAPIFSAAYSYFTEIYIIGNRMRIKHKQGKHRHLSGELSYATTLCSIQALHACLVRRVNKINLIESNATKKGADVFFTRVFCSMIHPSNCGWISAMNNSSYETRATTEALKVYRF